MRRAAKVDANHADIVKALRSIGCSVQSLAAIGKGVPDIMVSRRGSTFCLEIKDGSKPPSARKLTPDEAKWISAWRGNVAVVESVDEALDAADEWL